MHPEDATSCPPTVALSLRASGVEGPVEVVHGDAQVARPAPRWQAIETPPPVRRHVGAVVRALPSDVARALPPPPAASALSTGGWGEDESAGTVPVGTDDRVANDEWTRGEDPPTLLPAPRRMGQVETPPPYLTRQLGHAAARPAPYVWWALGSGITLAIATLTLVGWWFVGR